MPPKEVLEAIQKDITSFVNNSNLELNEEVMKYLKDKISSNQVELVIQVYLQKGQEVVRKCIFIVKEYLNKEM